MRRAALVLALAACGGSHAAAPDGGGGGGGDGADGLVLPDPIYPSDFTQPLDKAAIRAPQTWLDDATFEVKWQAMLASPIAMLGGADSGFHADLAARATPLPGDEVLCHGDAKLDNFGWMTVSGQGVFSDADFDDAGACPAAADILHFLLATDLWFGSSVLDERALAAYVATVADPARATAIDPATEPAWDTLRATGVDKDTHQDSLALGGDVVAASSDEAAAITALVAGDPRFPRTLLDVAKVLRPDGGSAGLRRYWLLVEDATHPRTIFELKELVTPGTELGPHSRTYDGPDRFDALKAFWWQVPAPDDHFGVMLLGARFMARDRYARHTLSDSDLSGEALARALEAEASLLALRHGAAWHHVDPDRLTSWLRDSAATLAARWRATYVTAGGVAPQP